MKKIKLTQSKYALVDDEDYEYLNQWKWCYLKGKQGSGYALRRPWVNNQNGKAILMHRLLLNTPQDKVCDHIDGNGINNQKVNLRNCTSTENKRNNKKHKGSQRFKGIYWDSKNKAYVARIGDNYIGRFKNEIHAAMVYDIWAKDIYGEFANTNFKKILGN